MFSSFFASLQLPANKAADSITDQKEIARSHFFAANARQLSTLEFYESKCLLYYISINDFASIDELPLYPGMMLERDADGVGILDHINNCNDQQLRDVVYQTISKYQTKSWEYLFMWFVVGDKLVTYEQYVVAAALNKLFVIKDAYVMNNYGADDTEALLSAILFDHREVARVLIARGNWKLECETPYPEMDMMHPVMAAIQCNRVEICRLFVDLAADKLSYEDKQSAFLFAVHQGSYEMTKLFLSLINTRQEFERAMDIAERSGFTNIYKLLDGNKPAAGPRI